MFCIKCGKEIDSNIQFCNNCGNKVGNKMNQNDTTNNKNKKFPLGIIILLVLCATFGILYYISGKADEASYEHGKQKEVIESTLNSIDYSYNKQ